MSNTNERAELIDAILISLTEYTHEGYVRDILSRAANMLAADANKAQQVAVPIPESQIDALSNYYLLAGAHECVLGVVEFVRAIEAHHKIGEKP